LLLATIYFCHNDQTNFVSGVFAYSINIINEINTNSVKIGMDETNKGFIFLAMSLLLLYKMLYFGQNCSDITATATTTTPPRFFENWLRMF
jgi:hypothetical protein